MAINTQQEGVIMALIKAKKVGTQTVSSMNVNTVADVRRELNGNVDGLQASVNGDKADDSKVLKDGDFVIFSKMVKGNIGS